MHKNPIHSHAKLLPPAPAAAPQHSGPKRRLPAFIQRRLGLGHVAGGVIQAPASPTSADWDGIGAAANQGRRRLKQRIGKRAQAPPDSRRPRSLETARLCSRSTSAQVHRAMGRRGLYPKPSAGQWGDRPCRGFLGRKQGAAGGPMPTDWGTAFAQDPSPASGPGLHGPPRWFIGGWE